MNGTPTQQAAARAAFLAAVNAGSEFTITPETAEAIAATLHIRVIDEQ